MSDPIELDIHQRLHIDYLEEIRKDIAHLSMPADRDRRLYQIDSAIKRLRELTEESIRHAQERKADREWAMRQLLRAKAEAEARVSERARLYVEDAEAARRVWGLVRPALVRGRKTLPVAAIAEALRAPDHPRPLDGQESLIEEP